MKWIRDLDMEKKNFIYHLNYHGRLKIMIYSNTCREQNLY